MLLDIHHSTIYTYSPQVNTAQHIAHLMPRNTPVQVVEMTGLGINPPPAQVRHSLDAFGNHRSFFSIPTAHTELSVSAHSRLETQPSSLSRAEVDHLANTSLPWEKLRERFRYQAGASFDEAQEFVFASPYVQAHAEFANYARKSFSPNRPALQATIELMSRIHQDFEYASLSTDVHTPALEALAQRRGVCQDFAHIMLACLRTLGLAARYVSGYVLTHPPEGQPRLIGCDASHAWVSLYLPEVGWFDLDPTNNRCGLNSPGEDYACVAWGRDFGDVSPVRGVIHGGASHTLQVAVTVTPLG